MNRTPEAEAAKRRRRNPDALQSNSQRLGVNEAVLDRTKWHYHYANDTGLRINNLTVHDDYEIAPEKNVRFDNGASVGSETAVLSDVDSYGRGIRSVLLRKPIEFHEEDVRAKQRVIDEQEARLRELPPDGADGGKIHVKRETHIGREE